MNASGFPIERGDSALIKAVQSERAAESDKFHFCVQAVGPRADYLTSLSLVLSVVLVGLLQGLKQIMD